ncbi:GNAT family N-acetyltransferase [Lutimaribacter marinistellae]|uniref:GNAT family N-acetyltransferase n=1 Tax=Lutimaribacter marinistellae TaxID=1820329 RepID=A0ABV7TKK7_9RHOB
MTPTHFLAPYDTADKPACLGVFDSNVPVFFGAEEREEFAGFLDHLPGPYVVMRGQGGAVLGCGGYAASRHDANVAVLCWGMVDRSAQTQQLGRSLLLHRLSRIKAEPAFHKVSIETSPESSGFFHRFGFDAVERVKDGFAPGRDMVRMLKHLQR